MVDKGDFLNKREVGAQKELLACEYLQEKGYKIVEQNYRCKVGEIDIVARDGYYLVFVEVKYRKNVKMGTPFEAIDSRKQKTIRTVAKFYMYENHISENEPIRFDAVGILGDSIEVIKDAF